jgi:hypothetical protein
MDGDPVIIFEDITVGCRILVLFYYFSEGTLKDNNILRAELILVMV